MPTTLPRAADPASLPPATSFDDRPVVVGVDLQGGSDAALAWAVEFARSAGRPVRAVMVAPSPTVFPSGIDGFGLVLPEPDLFEASVALERAIERALADPEARAAVERRIHVGSITECLRRESAQAALLVLGHGGSRMRRRLLSTARTVVGRAGCPVVVVPATPRDGATGDPGRPPAELRAVEAAFMASPAF